MEFQSLFESAIVIHNTSPKSHCSAFIELPDLVLSLIMCYNLVNIYVQSDSLLNLLFILLFFGDIPICIKINVIK